MFRERLKKTNSPDLRKETRKKVVVTVLVAICVLISVWFHIHKDISVVYTHLFYIPILLAGYWWGWQGLWTAVILAAGLLMVHSQAPVQEPFIYELLRIMEFLSIAALVAFLRERGVRSERLVREARHYYQNLFDRSSEHVIVWDLKRRITEVNQFYQQHTGLAAGEIVGKDVTAAFPEEVRDQVLSQLIGPLGERKSAQAEIPLKAKDGNRRVIFWNAAKIYSHDGVTLLGAMAHGQDFTGFKNIEEALEAAKRSFHQVVNRSADAIIILDSDGMVRYANPSAEVLFGRKAGRLAGEIIGFPVISGEAAEIDILAPDGSERVAEMRVVETRWEEENMFLASLRDVTERKQAQEELQRSYDLKKVINALLELSMEDLSLDEIVNRALKLVLSLPWLRDTGSIFLVENEADVLELKAVRGSSEQKEKTCRRVPFGSCFCGQAASTGRVQFCDSVNGRHEFSYSGMSPHGHYNVPILASGRTIGVLCVWVVEGHVREEKEEEFLRAIVNTLAGIILRKHIEEETEQMQAQLIQSQKMEALGRLAGGVAHDFNNLLTAIIGHTELFLLKHRQDDPERARLNTVLETAHKASLLTQQLLAISRRQVVHPVPLNINEEISEMSKMVASTIGENIDYRLVLEPDLEVIMGDTSQIEQIILNLIVNARDAMPEKGKLTVFTGNVLLDQEYCSGYPGVKPGNYVMISVSDTGTGIPPEIMEHIFDPFFTTKKKGSGLGLATVHGVVTKHGGHIDIDSTVGAGTTVKVYFPVIDDQTGEIKPALPRKIEAAPRGIETVLVLEDEPAILDVAETILAFQGYTVISAPTGREGLEKAKGHHGKIDLLLTDIVLPDTRGYEICSELAGQIENLKVILMSGYEDDGIPDNVIQRYRTRLLKKPFTAMALAMKVREVLDSP